MLIPLDGLHRKYDLDVNGILHVGAHHAEERKAYIDLGISNRVWIEANKDLYKMLKRSIRDQVICAVVSDTDGEEVVFHTANNGQSSSILDLGTHKEEHPDVHYVSEEYRTTTRLDTIISSNGLTGLDFINLDIQGVELNALRGLGDKLSDFNYIYTEVNKASVYVDCTLIGEIDNFLTGFDRVETVWEKGHNWGDAFYIRNGYV